MSNILHWLFGRNSLWCRLIGGSVGCYRRKIRVSICAHSGLLAKKCCPSVEEIFKEDDEPHDFCDIPLHDAITVELCSKSLKLATVYCPDVFKRTYCYNNVPIDVCTVHKKPTEPPIKHRLDPKKVYKPDGKHKLVSPVLIPTYGINRMIEEKDAEWFADKFAEQGWGNFMRLFVAGNWESFWQMKNRLWFPYLKEQGKFNLNKKNLKHFDCLFRRADYLAERDIMPMFTLLDNCSTHIGRPGFWSTNWMNGDRNVNGTYKEAYSLVHFYEYNGLPPHSNPAKKREGMLETGKFLMDLYGYVLDEAKKRYGKFFLIEIGNEIPARIDYHRMFKKFIDKKLGGNNYWRTFTSMFHDHFYASSVHKSCVPVVHGVQTIEDFETRKKFVPANSNYMVSCDGELPPRTIKATKEVVSYILNSDSKGYEGNIRPIFEWKNNNWVNVCEFEDWSLRSLRLGFCRAVKEAFEKYLG